MDIYSHLILMQNASMCNCITTFPRLGYISQDTIKHMKSNKTHTHTQNSTKHTYMYVHYFYFT